MNKTKVQGILVRLIFLVAFNAIFFLTAGFKNPASVWIAYAMIHASYLMLVCTPFFLRVEKTAMETGAPLVMLSGINFAIHFVLGLVFMLVASEKYIFEVVLYIILLSVYLFLFFTLSFTNAHTEASAKRQTGEVFFIRNQASKLKMLMGKIEDAELNKLLEITSDNMNASPTRSCGAAGSVEASITMKVCEIEMAVNEERPDDAKKSCKELTYLIDERKRIISMNN